MSYRKFLRKYAQDIIDRKRTERTKTAGAGGSDDGPKNDMLEHFLDLKMDDSSDVSDEQLCDMVLSMIIAGRDTTAQTMSCECLRAHRAFADFANTSCVIPGVAYRLSENPDIADKVRAEMDAVIGPDKDKLPSNGDIVNLKNSLAPGPKFTPDSACRTAFSPWVAPSVSGEL